MSATLLNKVKKTKTGNPTAKIILFYLADCSTERGCFPSQKMIADDLEISVRTVIRQLNYLESKGFISREFEYKTGKQNKTFYTVLGDNMSPIIGDAMGDNMSPKMDDNMSPINEKWVTSTTEMGDIHDTRRNIVFLNDKRTKKEVCFIFDEWKTTLNHPAAKLDKKRISRINARLADGFTVEQLKKVPHGVLRSPWHLGQNDTKTRYDGIDTIFRDAEQVEKFIKLAQNGNGQKAKGCPACLQSEYVARMSLQPGEVYDPARNVVTKCECVK